MSSPSTPFAELCGATVAVVARSLSPEASPHRTLRSPGSTVWTGVAVASLAFSMRLSTLSTVTIASFADKRKRF